MRFLLFEPRSPPTSHRNRCDSNTRGQSGGQPAQMVPKNPVQPAHSGFWGAPRKRCSDPADRAAAGNRYFTFTPAARPEGSGVIRKRGETIGVSPLVRPPRRRNVLCFAKASPCGGKPRPSPRQGSISAAMRCTAATVTSPRRRNFLSFALPKRVLHASFV